MNLRPFLEAAMRQRAAMDEAVVRDLLSRWVSELDPVLVRRSRDGEIIGLTFADAPLGSVPPVLWREGFGPA